MSTSLPANATGNGAPIAAVSGILGLAAIATWLGASVLSGRSWHAHLGLALVPAWAMAEVAGTPFGSLGERTMSAFAGLLPPVVTILLLLKAHRSPDVDTGLRPFRMLGLLLGAVIAVLIAVSTAVSIPMHAPKPVVITLGATVAAMWFGAAELCRRSDKLRVFDRRQMALALLAFGLAACDRTAGRLHTHVFVTAFSFTCARADVLIGWCLILFAALRILNNVRAAATARQRTLRVARDSVAETLAQQRCRIEEGRHDLRSLVAGIQGATTTLTRYRGLLDVGEQRLLESALLLEITRLQHAVNAAPSQSQLFGLRTAVEAVLTAERTSGAVIQARIDDVEVLGNADSTAAIVQNLVTNSRRHAPGATITVVGETQGGSIRLTIEDDGPGLPPAVRRRVDALFGGRASASSVIPRQPTGGHLDEGQPRTGLGLTICARLALEQ
ncbi:MAG: sensor histidine kinase, partial [Acidothermaceae bacterium]